MAATKTLRLSVRGHVQGVGYRAFVQVLALRLDVAGWVRNRPDGSVEGLFSGAPAAVDALCAACRQGPPGGRVDQLDVSPEPQPEALHGFTIRPTG
jgi:acylphosphatase